MFYDDDDDNGDTMRDTELFLPSPVGNLSSNHFKPLIPLTCKCDTAKLVVIRYKNRVNMKGRMS